MPTHESWHITTAEPTQTLLLIRSLYNSKLLCCLGLSLSEIIWIKKLCNCTFYTSQWAWVYWQNDIDLWCWWQLIFRWSSCSSVATRNKTTRKTKRISRKLCCSVVLMLLPWCHPTVLAVWFKLMVTVTDSFS